MCVLTRINTRGASRHTRSVALRELPSRRSPASRHGLTPSMVERGSSLRGWFEKQLASPHHELQPTAITPSVHITCREQ